MLGIDLGKSRTGLAFCDELETLACPDCVISEKIKKRLLKKIVEKITENEIKTVVIGYPKKADGTSGKSAAYIESFAQNLKKELKTIEIFLWDERFTTIAASKSLSVAGTCGRKKKKCIDAVAAALILQNFLDYKHNKEI
jgi:putative Holliday junction resolvase